MPCGSEPLPKWNICLSRPSSTGDTLDEQPMIKNKTKKTTSKKKIKLLFEFSFLIKNSRKNGRKITEVNLRAIQKLNDTAEKNFLFIFKQIIDKMSRVATRISLAPNPNVGKIISGEM